MVEIVVSNGAPWFVDRAPDGFTRSLRHVDVDRLRCLAANLAQAGGLCAAFDLGQRFEDPFPLGPNEDYPPWSPGCGRSATS
jgi:hypothetical protein